MLRFASLGSGSKGNGALIESGKTRVLLDCGFSLGETERRLHRLGCSPHSLTAILVTHEHGDHAAEKLGVAHGMTSTNRQPDRELEINDLHIAPFPVPHDAREPCQFVFSDGACRLGVLTDVGSHTPLIVQMLQKLDALMLECNYDADMLANGPYPPALQKRVAGRYGHLDNRQSTFLLEQIDLSVLQHLVGMHLSENNNLPEYALAALCSGVGCEQGWIQLANQGDGIDWLELR